MLIFLCITAFILLSCSKEDDYKKYLEGGAIRYPGKADSIKVHSGRNRILLTFLLLSDPNITSAKIYWNLRADSVEVPVIRTDNVDTVKVMIDSLDEGIYDFEIYTFDKWGNKSVPNYGVGKSYGVLYESTLVNRGIVLTQVIPNAPPYTDAMIVWSNLFDPQSGMIGTQINYTDMDNAAQQQFAPSDTTQNPTFLRKFAKGNSFTYKTMYVPDSLAIDTFYAPSLTITP
jgi:hypothetical protein